ncbi:MAG: GNAT family N-acetyltransferase [Candidatus Saliniplasma sp.]
MKIKLQKYNPKKHDKHVIADLIFRSDEEMNSLVYGKEPIDVIVKLLEIGDNYFDPSNTYLAIKEGKIVGVIVGFPVKQKSEMDKISGKAFAKAMGFLDVLKKMPLFLKMNKIVAGEMDEDGYYIHTISVSPEYQRQGIGSQMIEKFAKKYGKLYLHVNTKNPQAIKFYNKNGFQEKFRGKVKYKGKYLSECLMERIDKKKVKIDEK